MPVLSARTGQLGCACPEDAGARPQPLPGLALTGGFALMVLAQALTLGVLPLAAEASTTSAGLSGWPTAAFLLGAVGASLPAGLLLDAFGRRAALALGAGLGIAGAMACAHAVLWRAFPMLMVGAAWLGAAQGFAFAYRHVAAFGAPSGQAAGAVGRLIGAGALAGLAGPLVAIGAEGLFAPHLLVGTLLAAGLAQLGTLALATRLPEARIGAVERATPFAPMAASIAPTLVGMLAWMAMASAMVSAPLGLAACGVGAAGIGGVVAWHVLAMYAPALFAGPLARGIGLRPLAGFGLALAVAAAVTAHMTSEAASVAGSLLLVGGGWSLAIVATTAWLHRAGRPSRLTLAIHDGMLLAGAVAGAVMGGVA